MHHKVLRLIGFALIAQNHHFVMHLEDNFVPLADLQHLVSHHDASQCLHDVLHNLPAVDAGHHIVRRWRTKHPVLNDCTQGAYVAGVLVAI